MQFVLSMYIYVVSESGKKLGTSALYRPQAHKDSIIGQLCFSLWFLTCVSFCNALSTLNWLLKFSCFNLQLAYMYCILKM